MQLSSQLIYSKSFKCLVICLFFILCLWWRWGNTKNRPPPSLPLFAWGLYTCALPLRCTPECSPSSAKNWFCTHFSLFSFFFHSFSPHHIAPQPTIPLLNLPCFTAFSFSLTLLSPAFYSFHGDPNFQSHPTSRLFLFCTTFTFPLSSSPLVFPAIGVLSPLVSRGERQWVPAHSSDQSRAAGLPSHCW